MDKKIIYQRADNSIAVHQTIAKNLSTDQLMELGTQNTPNSLPFWIVEENLVSANRDNRNAWILPANIGDPSGYGVSERSPILAILEET